MRKIAIFDLDGTLVDSIDDLVLSANNTRKEFGLPPLCKEEISSFVGDGLTAFVERLFKEKKSVSEKEINVFKKMYKKHIVDNTRFYDGVLECTEKLRKNGFITGILSNKTEYLSKLVIEKLGAESVFSFVYGGDSFPEKKPSPLPIKKIMEMFEGDTSSSFMIGDSCNDIISGKKAGIKTIAVTFGFNGESHLKNCKADFYAYSPEDICRIILG